MNASTVPALIDSTRIHLVGCAGAGMRALAEFATDCGSQLTGSDAAPAPRAVTAFDRLGVKIRIGHAASHLPLDVDELVFSPAVGLANVERATAMSREVPQSSYPAVLGRLSRRAPTIAVAGTHGKSTATSLIAHLFEADGRLRGVLCGAETLGRGRHGWAHPDRAEGWLVMEACEYRRHFVEIVPALAVLLGIEPDHFDCFPRPEDAEGAYADFVANVSAQGKIIVNRDCPATRRVVAATTSERLISYSLTPGAGDWWAEQIVQSPSHLSFVVFYRGERQGSVRLPVLGRHHVANALAAIAAARLEGVSTSRIVEALARFPGVHRRLERLPDWRGVIRYDDYAHHPTAIRAVLAALREAHPERRLWCVFQPHQLSRTTALLDEFAAAVGCADRVLILPVYGAREGETPEFSEAARRMASRVASQGLAEFAPSLDHVRNTLETASRSGDLLVTLGAGDIDCVHHELAGTVSGHHSPG